MAGLTVESRQHVSNSPEEVWTYVVDGYFEHHPSWDPAIVGMDRVDAGPIVVGTRGVETRRFVTRQRAEFLVTACERPRRFAFRNTTGPFGLEREYRFAPEDDGTLLTFVFRMNPHGAMRLPFPLLRRTIAAQVQENIARIPSLVGAA